MRSYVLFELIILINQVLKQKLYLYLTDIERNTEPGKEAAVEAALR